MTSTRVKQRKGEFTKHRVQTDVSEGRACLRGLTAAVRRTYPFLPHPHGGACAPYTLATPFAPQLSISLCLLLLNSLSHNKKPLTLCLRQNRLPPVRALRDHVAWGCRGPLLKFELTEAVFHVSYCSTHVPLSSCNWNLQVSRLLSDHLLISCVMC